jgi:crossover junction endodeoxyribonuclease RusA
VSTATITLPWPPSVNTYWRSVAMGKRVNVVVSAEGRAYRAAIAAEVKRCWPGLTNPTQSRLAVYALANPPDRRRRDLDNILKALLDGLTHGGVWGDDSQVDDLHIERGNVVANGQVTVVISTLEGDVK